MTARATIRHSSVATLAAVSVLALAGMLVPTRADALFLDPIAHLLGSSTGGYWGAQLAAQPVATPYPLQMWGSLVQPGTAGDLLGDPLPMIQRLSATWIGSVSQGEPSGVLATARCDSTESEAWLALSRVSASGVNVRDPTIFRLASGLQVVIWVQGPDGDETLMQSESPSCGAPWSAPRPVSGASAAQVDYPKTAVAPDGTVSLTWSQGAGNGNPSDVFVSSRSSGTWSTPVQLSTGGDNINPQVAVNDASTPSVVWSNQSAGSQGVLESHGTDPGSWSLDAPVTRLYQTTFARVPDITPMGGASMAVGWLQTDNGGPYQFMVTSPAGGTWQSPRAVSPPDQNVTSFDFGWNPLAAGGAGLAAAWTAQTGFQSYVFATTVSGSTASAQTTGSGRATGIAPEQISTGGLASDISLTVSPCGGTVVAYTDRDSGGDYRVWSAVKDHSSSTWSAPRPLSDPLTQPPDISMVSDAIGDVSILWTGQRTDGMGIAATAAYNCVIAPDEAPTPSPATTPPVKVLSTRIVGRVLPGGAVTGRATARLKCMATAPCRVQSAVLRRGRTTIAGLPATTVKAGGIKYVTVRARPAAMRALWARRAQAFRGAWRLRTDVAGKVEASEAKAGVRVAWASRPRVTG